MDPTMKNKKQHFNAKTLLAFLFVCLLMGMTVGCDDDENPTNSTSWDPGTNPQDEEGNLVVVNNSGTKLVLARGEKIIKVLPNSIEDYLVNVDNPDEIAIDLKMYKYEDVKKTGGEVSSATVFKAWYVPLSKDTDTENRSTWFVDQNAKEKTTGTITYSYIGGTDNFVDIVLNTKTGAKVASLKPGDQNKQLGITYGNYTVMYRYWYSDQTSSEGPKDVGWLDKEVVNGNEVDIYLILNADRDSRHLQVPHWQGNGAIESQYGNIKITNNTSEPIQIWVGSELIENVMYTDKPIQNYSTIAALESIEYTMPADEYTFRAKSLTKGTTIQTDALEITADATIKWTVEE